MGHLIIDGANFLHRSRSGFQLGDYNVVFNFFRALRPLVERFAPDRVYFTTEGNPKRQRALLPEYKANRLFDPTTEKGEKKQKSLEDFWRQRALIMELLTKYFPVRVVNHPDFEGDDVVANIVEHQAVVVSTDTDFIQLTQQYPTVQLYNPVTKKFVAPPTDYNYVVWKALDGDTSDNIPRLLLEDRALDIAQKYAINPLVIETIHGKTFFNAFLRNKELIQLKQWSSEEAIKMTVSSPTRDWDAVKTQFNTWAFKSITKDDAWQKFVATFEPLWTP